MAHEAIPQFCDACGAKLAEKSRFCAQCGRALAGARGQGLLSPKIALYSVLLALPLWGLISFFSSSLAGKAPQQEMQAAQSDSELSGLRQVVTQQPDSAAAQLALAQALYQRMGESPNPMPLAFEAIDILSKLIKNDPQNKDAVLLMGDISFAQQAFPKAAELYRRFLTLDPTNPDVRAKYASAITFLGEFDQAIAELHAVIKEHPENFHANAYLSIAYAQTGKLEEAQRVGQTTLRLAPSDEARERFQKFLATLTAPAAEQGQSQQAPQNENAEEALLKAVRANPVAGPKLASSKQSSAEQVNLTFVDFPMQAMPPFVKEKFLAKIKAAAAPFKDIKVVALIDQRSGKEMERVQVR